MSGDREILGVEKMTVAQHDCLHCWLKAAAGAYLKRNGGSFDRCGSSEVAREAVGAIIELLAEFVFQNIEAEGREAALADAARWSRDYLATFERHSLEAGALQ